MAKISWVILTYNRAEIVERAFHHNLKNAGDLFDELIWVDNGSQEQTDILKDYANVIILNTTNLGVAKGYNRAMAMATGDYIVITGCDMLMPDNWLKTFRTYVETIPETVCACMYTNKPEEVADRYMYAGRLETHKSGLSYIQAMPMDRRIFKRSLLKEVGYFREDFGLYGWEDVEWGARVMRYLRENKNLLSYLIPEHRPVHLQLEESYKNDPVMQEYQEFKKKLSDNPENYKLLDWCFKNNYPFYSPY